MARARMIKPEFFEDEKIGSISRDARLTYIGLWNLADDVGNVKVNPMFVRNRLFPYDGDVDITDVALWMTELEEVGRLERYVVEGESYAHISKFTKHQTINKPSTWRNPTPDSGSTTTPLLHHSGSTHVGVTSEDKDKDKDKVKVKRTALPAEAAALFAAFWNQYPSRNGKKVGKAKAERAFERLSKINCDRAMIAVGHYAAACNSGKTLAKDAERFLRPDVMEDWHTPALENVTSDPTVLCEHGVPTKACWTCKKAANS